jgi:hypothetical protein
MTNRHERASRQWADALAIHRITSGATKPGLDLATWRCQPAAWPAVLSWPVAGSAVRCARPPARLRPPPAAPPALPGGSGEGATGQFCGVDGVHEGDEDGEGGHGPSWRCYSGRQVPSCRRTTSSAGLYPPRPHQCRMALSWQSGMPPFATQAAGLHFRAPRQDDGLAAECRLGSRTYGPATAHGQPARPWPSCRDGWASGDLDLAPRSWPHAPLGSAQGVCPRGVPSASRPILDARRRGHPTPHPFVGRR